MTRLQAPTPRVAVVIAAAIVIGFVLLAAGSAIRPFVVGLLLAYLLDPLVERFARRGVPRGLAVLLVFAISIGVVVLALAIAIPPLVRQIAVFTDELPDIVRAIQYQLDHLNELYDQLGLPQELRAFANSLVAAGLDAAHHLDISFLRPLIDSAASFVTSIFGYLILPVWLFFLLKDRPGLPGAMDRALPTAWRPDAWAIAGIVRRCSGVGPRPGLAGRVVGIATFIGLEVLGFTVDPVFGRFAVLLAVIAGVLGELDADHRPDHRGDAGRDARPDRRRGAAISPAVVLYPRSSRSRTTCSCRRSRATPSSSTRARHHGPRDRRRDLRACSGRSSRSRSRRRPRPLPLRLPPRRRARRRHPTRRRDDPGEIAASRPEPETPGRRAGRGGVRG